MQYKDYYEILGVSRSETQANIKSAYRKLARKFHPDVNKEKGAAEKFKDINEAYEVLGDPDKRARYDQLGANWQQGADFTPPPGFEGFNFSNFGAGSGGNFGGFSDFFSAIFGDIMQNQSRGSSRRTQGDFGFGGGDYSQFYNQGASAKNTQKPKSENLDITQNLFLTVDDLINTPTKTVTVVDFSPCRYCKPNQGGFCSHCSGTGIEKITKNLTVKVPKFVKEGQKIRLKNEGKTDYNGNRGDLFLTVKIKDENYKVQDFDLETEVEILPSEAVLGAKKEIITPIGKISLAIPKNTNSGKTLRLKGLGLPKKDGGSGNLNAKVKIILPQEISPEAQKLYEELAKLGN